MFLQFLFKWCTTFFFNTVYTLNIISDTQYDTHNTIHGHGLKMILCINSWAMHIVKKYHHPGAWVFLHARVYGIISHLWRQQSFMMKILFFLLLARVNLSRGTGHAEHFPMSLILVTMILGPGGNVSTESPDHDQLLLGCLLQHFGSVCQMFCSDFFFFTHNI